MNPELGGAHAPRRDGGPGASPLARAYEETLRHLPAQLVSFVNDEEGRAWLASHGPRRAPRRIIDLGCGQGQGLAAMIEAARPRVAVGVDVSSALLEEAAERARGEGRSNVLYVRASLNRLPFAAPAFGWVSCAGALHRLARPSEALRSFGALVEPGGAFTCIAARELEGALAHLAQRLAEPVARLRFFSREELVAMLYRSGLEPTAIELRGAAILLAARRPAPSIPTD